MTLTRRLRGLAALTGAVMLIGGLSACSDAAQPADPTPETTTTGSPTESTTAENSTTGTTGTTAATDGDTTAPSVTTTVDPAPTDSSGIALGPGGEAPAGQENVDLRASSYADLRAGDEITLQISGLNPEVGYYAAICAADTPPGSPAPACTGEQADTSAQVWLKTEGGTDDITPDGTAEVTLTAAASGRGVDCTVDNCVIKVFGDHTEAFRDVADLPVSFASN